MSIGGEHWIADVRSLDVDEAVGTLAGFEARNRIARPVVRRVFSLPSGATYDGSQAARQRLAERRPLIGLRRAHPSRVKPGA